MKRSAVASKLQRCWFGSVNTLRWLRPIGRLRAGAAHHLHLIRPNGRVANATSKSRTHAC